MKILWLCNVVLPYIGMDAGVNFSMGGGWLITASLQLSSSAGNTLMVCCPTNDKGKCGQINKVNYILFNEKNSNLRKDFIKILSDEKPDVIHIFGTEFKHTLDMIHASRECNMIHKTVISIQGLVSECAKCYTSGLRWKDVFSFTLRDLIKGDNIFLRKQNFKKRGKDEKEAIRICKNFIGRTDWDECCVKKLNPDGRYFYCGETLRNQFYQHSWDYSRCQKHSIFFSQCNYPIKGFHILLKEFPNIMKDFPDACIYTTGPSPIAKDWKNRLFQTYYKRLLGKMIRKYGLEGKVHFLGNLDETQMCQQYLKANVFLSCSVLENSPNSVGEAMLLGVPVVASDVGGVKNLITHHLEGFVYPVNEPYMIPYYVRKCFEMQDAVSAFTLPAKTHSFNQHDPDRNFRRMLEIYAILSNESSIK